MPSEYYYFVNTLSIFSGSGERIDLSLFPVNLGLYFDQFCLIPVNSTVPEYDVIKLSPHKTKRNTHHDDDKRIYKMSAFGKDLLLDLRQTTDSISPSGILVQRRTKDGLLEEEIFKPEGKFFHGHVVSDPGSRVALRETGDKGELVRIACSKSIVLSCTFYNFCILCLKERGNL